VTAYSAIGPNLKAETWFIHDRGVAYLVYLSVVTCSIISLAPAASAAPGHGNSIYSQWF
jgi:hypothetical protein